MSTSSSILVTVVGRDSPGIAARLFALLSPLGYAVCDVEQVHVHGRLLLCVELRERLAIWRTSRPSSEAMTRSNGAIARSR